MSSEERGTWSIGIVSIVGYATYLGLLATFGIERYAILMAWTIGGAIVLGIVITIIASIIVGMVSPRDLDAKDSRDREINRYGEYIGRSMVVVGATTALVLALLDIDQFWIANVIYLGFVLSGILSSIAKLIAYRKGFVNW